jgi:hypothetical protein
MAEMVLERGLLIHSSCIWRRIQIYGPELEQRWRAHRKRTYQSYRVDETYIQIKGQERSVPSRGFHRADHRFPLTSKTRCSGSQAILS